MDMVSSDMLIYDQRLYGSWKVLEFYFGIFQDWKVLEN